MDARDSFLHFYRLEASMSLDVYPWNHRHALLDEEVIAFPFKDGDSGDMAPRLDLGADR